MINIIQTVSNYCHRIPTGICDQRLNYFMSRVQKCIIPFVKVNDVNADTELFVFQQLASNTS